MVVDTRQIAMAWRVASMTLLLVGGSANMVGGVGSCAELGGSAANQRARLDDLPKSFRKVSTVRALSFDGGQARLPEGGHVQGIQMCRNSSTRTAFLTRSSNSQAVLLVLQWAGQQNVGQLIHQQFMPTDGRHPPLRHPGGCQLVGDFLVVGVEDNQDKLRSVIQFWNVSEPRSPRLAKHLTIHRESRNVKEKTAGAVAIAKRRGSHLLAVANWDSAAIDFYESNGMPLTDARCRFSNLEDRTWTAAESDRSQWEPDQIWGKYQSINMFGDRSGRLFLIGFDTDSNQRDVADLFLFDEDVPARRSLRKLQTKELDLGQGIRFQAGAGAGLNDSGDLEFYATQYDLQTDGTIAIVE